MVSYWNDAVVGGTTEVSKPKGASSSAQFFSIRVAAAHAAPASTVRSFESRNSHSAVRHGGAERRLTDVHGEVIREVLA
jgi:hypothetical protein